METDFAGLCKESGITARCLRYRIILQRFTEMTCGQASVHILTQLAWISDRPLWQRRQVTHWLRPNSAAVCRIPILMGCVPVLVLAHHQLESPMLQLRPNCECCNTDLPPGLVRGGAKGDGATLAASRVRHRDFLIGLLLRRSGGL
jgi:hypothetical protein